MGKERYGSDDKVDGQETVGNSMGRAPLGRSDTEAMRGWTERKPWEISRGELRGEGAGWKRRRGESSVKKERDGSDDRVDGGETVGNSMGGALWGRNGWKRRQAGRKGNRGK